MSRTVLIVDDSPQHASTLEIALSGLPGIQVLLSASAQKALRLLSGENGVDVCALVTDLNMPGMDGYELIERLRTDGERRNIPVIALSGDTNPRARERATSAGADAFFVKPCSPSVLRQTLERLLNRGPV